MPTRPRPGRPARRPPAARTSPARRRPVGTGPASSRSSCSSSASRGRGRTWSSTSATAPVSRGPSSDGRHGQTGGQSVRGRADRDLGPRGRPASAAPRGGRRPGRCRAARSGCRGPAGRPRPTRPGGRRPGPPPAPPSRATRPSASSGSVRQSSTVWRTSTWSGTGTGPGAAFS